LLVTRISKTLLPICALSLLLGSCANKEKPAPQAQPNAAPAEVEGRPAEHDAATKADTQGGDLGYGDEARLFDSPAAAMKVILESKPKIIGFGEFHKLESSAAVQSALRRFADDIIDVVGPQSGHLVLETWSVDPRCGAQGEAVTKKVEATIQRPKENENEMQTLMRKAQEHDIRGYVLQFSCEEYAALLGKGKAKGALDTEKLLETVSKKLGEQGLAASRAATEDELVLLYGGATHNDLFPYPGLEAWSYAQELVKESGKSFVEVDLYVPELVVGDKLLSQEAWYPLLKEARSDQVILIRRDPTSYILLMRKDYAQPPAARD
jgi:hypothetical protein